MSAPTRCSFTASETSTSPGARKIADALGDGDCQPDHIVRSHFNLAVVNTSADLSAQGSCPDHNLQRGMNRAGRRVKGSEKSVPGGLHLTAPVAPKSDTNHCVVVIGELGQFAMSHSGRLLRRGNNVGEQDRGRDNVALGRLVRACQELLDLVYEGVNVADEERVVIAGQFDILGTGDVLGQIPTGPGAYESILFSVDDKGG